MIRASTEVFASTPSAPIEMAGRTDRSIAAELATQAGRSLDPVATERLHVLYLRYLEAELRVDSVEKRVLPGVRPMLDELARRPDVCLSLLTGNLQAGARAKLEHFDLWQYFPCGAFGDLEPERHRLFAVALERARSQWGCPFVPSDVIVIGDTPSDIDVGLLAGARAVAVATGPFDALTLARGGAHAVLETFEDLDQVLEAFGLSREAER